MKMLKIAERWGGALIANALALFAPLATDAAWYDSPSVSKALPLAANGSGTIAPHFMNKAEDDSLLIVNLQSSGDSAPTVVIDMAQLADPAVVAGDVAVAMPVTKPSDGYGAQWKGGAVSAKLKTALIGSALSKDICAIKIAPAGSVWAKGSGLKPLAISNGYFIDGLDFAPDSSAVYSNEYNPSARRGYIAKWTYDEANGQLVFVKDFQTSLSRIRDISVYSVNGKTLVYAGEGASGNSKVVAIDVTGDTWTETELSGPESLGEEVTSVKLSNEDSETPVMYVLCDAGQLGVYTLAADGLSVASTVKTFTNAELLKLCGKTSAISQFRNLEVTKDGKTAFLMNPIDGRNAVLTVITSAPYLESDGSQFVNTGYYVGPNTKIELDYSFTDSFTEQMRIIDNFPSAQGSGLAATVYVSGSIASDTYTLAIAGGDYRSATDWNPSTTRSVGDGTRASYCDAARRTLVIDEKDRRVSISENGTEVWHTTFSQPSTLTATFPLGLFGRTANAAATAADCRSRIRVYGLKFYESDELVRDFRPVTKNGTAGLLDRVTGLFITDTRTTPWALATGGDIETDDDPYVESDGSGAISTGIVAQPRMRIECDYALTGVNAAQTRLFGQEVSPKILAYINGSGMISINSSDSADASNTGITTNSLRHTIMICNTATTSERYFITGVTTNFAASLSEAGSTVTAAGVRPLAIFGRTANDDGTSFDWRAKMRLYGMRIWVSGELVRDYRPRNINGTAGLEDVVEGGFFTCAGLSASANAPTEMETQDGYIESAGSALFDTHYFPNRNTKIEVDFRQTRFVNGSDGIFGHDGSFSAMLYGRQAESSYLFSARDGGWSGIALSPAVKPNLFRHKMVIDVPNRKGSLYAADGTLEGEAAFASNWTYGNAAGYPLSLFAWCNNKYGTAGRQQSYVRIYGAKIWDNGTLVRDYVPAVQGGIAGFYDRVSGKFNSAENLTGGGNLYDAGSETYLENETTSKCYFDTGLYVTDKTKVVIDFMPLAQQNAQQFPFDAGDYVTATDDSKKMQMRTYGNRSDGTGNYAYTCGSQQSIGSDVAYRPFVRRKLTLDAKNLKFLIETPDGNTVQDMTISAIDNPNQSSSTLKIFGNATDGGNTCRGRLYRFQVYENDVLLRDYVPVCAGGTYCLYDSVTATTVSKASGSVTSFAGGDNPSAALDEAFFAAGMREDDAYIESDGTQAINLGYFTTPGTRYEIDYRLKSAVAQSRPFGASSTWPNYTTLNAELYIQGGGTVAFGVGVDWVAQATGVSADLNRHVAVLDLKNRECGYSGRGLYAFADATVCTNTSDFATWLFAKGSSASGDYASRTAMRLYAFRIYEDGELVHEWLPYRSAAGAVGIYDTMTGDVKYNSVSGATDFVYGGGAGYGKYSGTKVDLVTAPQNTMVQTYGAATLSAYAPGAVAYVWKRNGVAMAGATGDTLDIAWRRPRGNPIDTYAVSPVYIIEGEMVEGESRSCTVENQPTGGIIILR